MSLEMCHLLFIYVDVDFRKLLENALRFETDVVLLDNILSCSADFLCVDGPTMQEV